MATITQLIMIDDLDGTESAEPGEINAVRFSLDGAEYEIDLTEEHDQELRELLAPYIAVGRQAVVTASKRRGRRSGGDPEAEAQRHYDPIAVPEYARAGWPQRTANGCERTLKVAQWTLTERIAALSENNIKLLGQYMGEVPTSSGRRPKLGMTEARFRNLEIIDFDGEVTPFGRYAYDVRFTG
ncbi:histone-like nucleoid-structuring protein Lsr2 [Streptomyces antarcticus]|uniref:histone-like nucleoid-structuring protein Lsr2 n=1 Tax=Streptomyces antarcticus TaxID=2996458 RepID=UPI00226F128E|nr:MULTISPECIES: Lsr2 family protein [unclassified Streptomyces]MCY0941921.1 Lsr2 family protein [Streptomyces sp. H34-AA3]MCZ4082806.1 Lsr2 family protein [Streptomyces sp. H34-S5]